MHVSVSDAKGRLTDLVRRVEAGEEVVLTRHGREAVRLVRVTPTQTAEERLAIIEDIRRRAVAKARPGPCAARSHDFLYDEDGLPG